MQTTDSDGKKTYWLYTQAGQVLYSYEARRSQTIAYIYLGNSQIATRTVASGSGTVTVHYEHTDALGSPVAETDAPASPGTALTITRHSYMPCGSVFSGLAVDGTGYTGHVMDADTGLTYMQQRYYDPQIGRFISTDPMPFDPNTGANFNRYWYAKNNPYRFTDPDGRVAKGNGSTNGAQNGNTCQDSAGCWTDPMDDPNRPSGCGSSRNCWRDSSGKWHTDGPGGIYVVGTVRISPKTGDQVTTFRSRPMTDQEARTIFKLAGYAGADDVPMDQDGRDLAMRMYWQAKDASKPMGYLFMIFKRAQGAGGRVETAFELVRNFSDNGLPRDRNYAQLFAEHGLGVILAVGYQNSADYQEWLNRQTAP